MTSRADLELVYIWLLSLKLYVLLDKLLEGIEN